MDLRWSGLADKFARTFWGLLILSACLAGCGSDLSQPEEGVVRVWVTWGDEPQALQSLFNSYVQRTGQPVRVATSITDQQIQEAFEAGEPPELLILNANDLVGDYSARGWIETLSLNNSETSIELDDFFRSPLEQCRLPNQDLMCLPWGADLLALYWNKDHFQAAGLNPDLPPQSAEEMLHYAELLTQRNGMGEIVQIGYIPDFPRSYLSLYMTVMDDSGSQDQAPLPFNPSVMMEALQWERQFYQSYGSQTVEQIVTSFTPFWGSNHASYAGRAADCQECHRITPLEGRIPGTGFYSGRVSMIVGGFRHLGPTGIPQFQQDLNYGVGVLPTFEAHPGNTNQTRIQGPVVILPVGSADPEGAMDLLEWMMSAEVAADFASMTSLLPITETAALDPRFHQSPDYELFLSWLENNSGAPNTILPNQQQINRIVSQFEILFLRQGGSAEATVDQILAEIGESQSP